MGFVQISQKRLFWIFTPKICILSQILQTKLDIFANFRRENSDIWIIFPLKIVKFSIKTQIAYFSRVFFNLNFRTKNWLLEHCAVNYDFTYIQWKRSKGVAWWRPIQTSEWTSRLVKKSWTAASFPLPSEKERKLRTMDLGIVVDRELRYSQCLKITEKVSFNIASEASYVYILSGEKFIKKCQK